MEFIIKFLHRHLSGYGGTVDVVNLKEDLILAKKKLKIIEFSNNFRLDIMKSFKI